MDTERTDYHPQLHPNRDAATSTMDRDRWPQAASSLRALDEAVQESRECRWAALLDAARDQRPARLLYCFVFKRWLDVLIASAALVLLAPLMLIVALVIWLDTRGTVLYRHHRIGRYGQPFTMYKFCTMIPDRRQTSEVYTGTERRKSHKTAADPRVTRTGRFMRRASIDELPQLFNVLRGEMSIIGPRPELPAIVGRYEAWQHQRHLVLPGITGWWQTHGRSDLMMHEHTELDIYYVENISFMTDMRVLLRTARALTVRAGAF